MIYIYIDICKHAYIYAYVYTYMNMCVCVYTYTHALTDPHAGADQQKSALKARRPDLFCTSGVYAWVMICIDIYNVCV